MELGRNPEVQKTLYEEIMSITPSGDFTMEDIGNMDYLEMVVKEGLRIYPQVPFMERQIMDEFELGRFRSNFIFFVLTKIHFFRWYKVPGRNRF